METLEEIRRETLAAASELLEASHLTRGQILVVGCSSSEIIGQKIGSASSPEVAEAVADALLELLVPRGIVLAAQCCEHLNRAIILESSALLPGTESVNVVPQPKAGGSFATAVYRRLAHPAAVEVIRADAGLDIGGTLIGMHLKPVAVPIRLAQRSIGEAMVLAARTRPKFIGGARACYDPALL